MASRLELITMEDVYRDIIADLEGIETSQGKELKSKYKSKLKDIEERLRNLGREGNDLQSTKEQN